MTSLHREARWRELVEDGRCFQLEPFIIDGIISGDIHARIKKRASSFGYTEDADFLAADCGGFSSFVHRAAEYIRRKLNVTFTKESHEDLISIIRVRIIEAVPAYRVGNTVDGIYTPYSFEAYLYNFPILRALQDFAAEAFRVNFEAPSCEYEIAAPPTSSYSDSVHIDLLQKIFEAALTKVLDNSQASAVYCLYHGAGMNLEVIAKHLNITTSVCYKHLMRVSDHVASKVQEDVAVALHMDVESARREVVGVVSPLKVVLGMP